MIMEFVKKFMVHLRRRAEESQLHRVLFIIITLLVTLGMTWEDKIGGCDG